MHIPAYVILFYLQGYTEKQFGKEDWNDGMLWNDENNFNLQLIIPNLRQYFFNTISYETLMLQKHHPLVMENNLKYSRTKIFNKKFRNLRTCFIYL